MCGESLAVLKKANLESHYSTKHARISELQGQVRRDKTNALLRSWFAQQAAFTRPNLDRDNVVHASYVVSEVIAKKLKPYSDGEFVKE